MNSQLPRAQYKYLTMISMVYITIMLAGNILTYKFVHALGITLIAGSLLTPLWFVIGDIVTEVYGYAAYRRLIWQALICSALFTLLCLLLVILPSPIDWHYQSHFDYILLKLPRILLSSVLGIFVGSFLNSYVISKWKILIHGKYFWIRSVGSSAMGELIFTVITMTTIMLGEVSFSQMIQFILISYLLKLTLSSILAAPSVLITRSLKHSEQVDVYDHNVNFNPFKVAEK